ncbi:MAG: helix-hairpin-helix domain-containing protein [Bacteroidota bacterium]
MNWKEFARDYLHFTRRDRIAILAIIAIIIVVFLTPEIISKNASVKAVQTDTAWVASLKQLEQKETAGENQPYSSYNDDNADNYKYDRSKNKHYPGEKAELFYFDPNTLSPEGWEKLGLREKTIRIIQNYLNKGGRFRKPEDVKKIYGLFTNEYERIAPFIRIAAEQKENNSYNESAYQPAENAPAKTYTPRYPIIDINAADTTAFISLPGIGSKLSARIVNFRDKLGGFYSINQVAETFGLPDSTFQKIKQYLKLEDLSVRKININTATVDELKAHPYIRYSLANPIIAYRKEHGPFARVEDIKKVMAVTEEIYQKISPYLSLQ